MGWELSVAGQSFFQIAVGFTNNLVVPQMLEQQVKFIKLLFIWAWIVI